MLLWVGLIGLAIFLQSAVFGMLPFPGVAPDLVLIVLMYAAFTKGAGRGAAVGFAGGLAEDFASGGLLGVNALVKVVLGYLLGTFRKKVEYESRSFQFIAVFLVSCIAQGGAFLIMQLSGRLNGLYLFRDVFFPSALLNAVLGPFVFRLLEGLEKYDRSKFD